VVNLGVDLLDGNAPARPGVVLAQIEFDGAPGEGDLGRPAVQQPEGELAGQRILAPQWLLAVRQRAGEPAVDADPVEKGAFDEVESVLFAVGGDLGRRSVVDMEFVKVGHDPPVVRPGAHLFPDERGVEILVPRSHADFGEVVPRLPHHFHGRTQRRVRTAFDVAYHMEAFDSQLPVMTQGIGQQRRVAAHHGNEA
jgi:hypothetical protein